MAENKRPQVGIGILVFKDKKIMLTKRKGVFGSGEWTCPGGHLEFNESIEDCARRECKEEAGIEIKNIKFIRLSNMRRYNRHYVDIGLIAQWVSGTPQRLEPEKLEDWDWYSLDDLPKPLFGEIEQTLKALKTGKNFFDN